MAAATKGPVIGIKSYGVAPDGRFLTSVNQALAAELLGREPLEVPAPPTHLHVVQPWFEELQRLVPSP